MSPDEERRRQDFRVIRELHDDFEAGLRRLDSLAERLEKVAVVAEQVRGLEGEVKILRKNIDGPKGILDRVAVLESRVTDSLANINEKLQAVEARMDVSAGLPTKPSVWAAVIGGLGLVLVGVWQAVQWLLEFTSGNGP